MIRIVLFDIDGTLIATGGAGLRAFASVARTTFRQDNGLAHLNFAGRTDPSIVREFFGECRIPATQQNFARFFDDYLFWLDHFLHELGGRVLPGVHPSLNALRALSDPPLLGLLTGNIRLGAELKLRRFNLWQEFSTGAFGDDHEDRNQIAAIAKERGVGLLGRPVEGSETLVIGDTPLDIACARAIGAKCLAVATGGASAELLASHNPDWLVSTLEEVDLAALCR